MKIPEKILLACNLKKEGADGDLYEEYDEPQTIEAIVDEIEKCGFEVEVAEQDGALYGKLFSERPDFVFNIAEGLGGARARESQMPCLLESLGIPYTGSDGLSLALSLDKYLTNSVLARHGIPVPDMYNASDMKDFDRLRGSIEGKGYFLVKPRWEGSSKGIFLDSLLNDFSAIRDKTRSIISDYGQPAVIEEFLYGDEITAAVIGNVCPRVLGMMRIEPVSIERKDRFVYSIELKRDWKNAIRYDGQESISAIVRQQVEKSAVDVFRAMELRDIARIDFRLDKNGIPRVIDVNPLPGLSPHYSDLPILYRLDGGYYGDIIKGILKEALTRYDLELPDCLKDFDIFNRCAEARGAGCWERNG